MIGTDSNRRQGNRASSRFIAISVFQRKLSELPTDFRCENFSVFTEELLKPELILHFIVFHLPFVS